MFSYYCPCLATLLACATADLIAFIWLYACACACVAWSSGFPESPLQSVAWMDGWREEGREEGRDGKHTTGKTNYRTEGPWAKAYTHTHTQHLCFFLSHRQTLTRHCCYTYSVKDGLSLSSATFTTIKITTVWLDNNPNAVTSTVVKGETQLDTSEKPRILFFLFFGQQGLLNRNIFYPAHTYADSGVHDKSTHLSVYARTIQ